MSINLNPTDAEIMANRLSGHPNHQLYAAFAMHRNGRVNLPPGGEVFRLMPIDILIRTNQQFINKLNYAIKNRSNRHCARV